jgi:3'-phosphoadenosine 5'-phosphosulfate sulfotransferase (PAPS reductase)/FAD synthetase
MIFQLIESMDDNLNIQDKKVLIGVSGGINSAAVLSWLLKYCTQAPSELHLFCADFKEHSPRTLEFCKAQFELAKDHFKNTPTKVFTTITNNSILGFCETMKSIPVPQHTPCTRIMKIVPITEYMYNNQIDFDLVGYVRGEESRMIRQNKRGDTRKIHPIKHADDNDCFMIVKEVLGWYPEIYDFLWTDKRIGIALSDGSLDFLTPQQKNIIAKRHKQGFGWKKGKRVFKHNNCLPCKNMHSWELATVKIFFPKYFNNAIAKAEEITNKREDKKEVYWGRKDEYSEIPTSCTYCAFD